MPLTSPFLQILLEDGTVVSKLCGILSECHFRTVHNATLTYPRLANAIGNVKVVKMHSMIEWGLQKKSKLEVWPDTVLRASGYKEDLGWWAHNRDLAQCVSSVPNPAISRVCCLLCIACSSSQSLRVLLPGKSQKCERVPRGITYTQRREERGESISMLY